MIQKKVVPLQPNSNITKNTMVNKVLYNAEDLQVNMRAAIQQSGKLSFTATTAEHLHIDEQTRFLIYGDKDNADLLYLVRTSSENTQAFRVRRTGMYFYMPTRALFEQLHYNYLVDTYLFDIFRDPDLDEEFADEEHPERPHEVYRLKRRIISKTDGVLIDEE